MNPYEVLGVSPSADKEEIRAAYLTLVKKYHPDRYQDSALKAQAEEKMKQINAAYDMLTKEPKAGAAGSYGTGGSYGAAGSYGTGGSYSGSYSGSYGQHSGSYSGSYGQSGASPDYARIRQLINEGRVTEAEALLSARPRGDAEWYFLCGMCAYRRGRYATAYEYISRACSMAPDNAEYGSVLSALRGAGSTGTGRSVSLGNNGYCGLCGAMLCANLFCGYCCR